MTFGEKLKILRERSALTQSGFADTITAQYNCRVTREDVANWEVGRHYPKWPAAVAISKYFSVSLDDLFYPEKNKMFKELKRKYFM